MPNFPLWAVPVWLIAINALGAGLTVLDKRRARAGGWRVRESTLFATAFLGGTPGVLAAMYAVRHKTKKPKFRFGMPLLLTVQLLLALGAGWLWFHR